MYNHKIMEKNLPDEWLKDLPVQTENIGYKPEEMIRCEKCQRTNPPTRLKCFYCASDLIVSEAQNQFLKPNLRKLEIWEKGFNVILLPNSQIFDEAKLNGAAKLLKLEKVAHRCIIFSNRLFSTSGQFWRENRRFNLSG